MDTLCVPIPKTLKKVAIAKMKSTYETVSKVLVRSRFLASSDSRIFEVVRDVSKNHYMQMAIPTVYTTRGEGTLIYSKHSVLSEYLPSPVWPQATIPML